MIDVVSGSLAGGRDWSEVWLASQEHENVSREMDRLESASGEGRAPSEDDEYEFAATNVTQLRLTVSRASVQMWRNTDYIINKIALHVGTGLTNGFSFWMLVRLSMTTSLCSIFYLTFHVFACNRATVIMISKDVCLPSLVSFSSLVSGTVGRPLRLGCAYTALISAGVIAQLQPKFIANRDIYETREKKAKMYTWVAVSQRALLRRRGLSRSSVVSSSSRRKSYRKSHTSSSAVPSTSHAGGRQ
jgi:ATP-binding cassette subfamily G (WHITE) protein 2 (SNQ2)